MAIWQINAIIIYKVVVGDQVFICVHPADTNPACTCFSKIQAFVCRYVETTWML